MRAAGAGVPAVSLRAEVQPIDLRRPVPHANSVGFHHLSPLAWGLVQVRPRAGSTHGPLGEETERRQRRRAGAALVWNNRETEMGDLAEIEALFFALIGGSPGAEVVFLNQNLAV